MMSRPQREGEAAEEANRKSALPSERVVLLVLCALLAAALIIIHRLSVSAANQTIQALEEENEALRKDLLGKRCLVSEGDWEFHGENCYNFNIYGHTWEESKHWCRDHGGDLVKISSREEQEFLVGRVRDLTTEGAFWIGLTDSETEDSWMWVDGSPLNKSLTFWSPGEPNNAPTLGGEDCVMMELKNRGGDLNTWSDYACVIISRFICEKSAESEQSSCV